MDLEELTSPFTWEYDNVSGFLKQLSYPNGLVRKNIYHPTLNLFHPSTMRTWKMAI